MAAHAKPRVLYRLPKVIEAVRRGDAIYVVEGEKDVHPVERAPARITREPFCMQALSPSGRFFVGGLVHAFASADMGPKSEQHLHEEFLAMLTAKKLAIAPSDAQRHAHDRTTALVRASLQAGIHYDRRGHLAKPAKTR